jgi:putative transposase
MRDHLARCVVYIDLNMVCAGVVAHPAQWEQGGYHEIQREPARYRIVDRRALAEAAGVKLTQLAAVHGQWVEAALRVREQRRRPLWTESLAVGEREFVEQFQCELGGRARQREIEAYKKSLRSPTPIILYPSSLIFHP